MMEWIHCTLEVFQHHNYECLLVAIKGPHLAKKTSHSLNLTWVPQDYHACSLENITVTAEASDRNQTLSCVVYKRNFTNFCIIKGLTPSTNYTVKAISCTNTAAGCINMEGYISTVTNPGKQ